MFKSCRRYVVFASCLIFLNASVCAATTYYVAPTGSDSNSGTQALPFREIRKALTLVQPGDTILVADGQYLGFDVDTKNGNANSPITIQAQGTGAQINVTSDRVDNRDTIKVTASSYIVIDGLRSFSATRSAMRIDQSSHITARNCVFGNNTVWGIFTDFADDLLLENNECYGSVQQHGIYVSNTCTRPTVRGNRLHDNFANGLHMNGDVSQGGAGIITNALVENNVIYNNGAGGGSGINCDGVQSSVIQNNVIYAAHGAGISLYQIDASAPSINNVVVNNTIDVASNGKWGLQIHDGSSGCVVFNNIFLTHNANHGSLHFTGPSDLVGLVSDYNIFTTQLNAVTPDDDSTNLSLAQWQAQNHDTHSSTNTQAALFVDYANGDFHLLGTAAALDAGVSSLSSKNAPAKDAEGNSRPQGTGLDIGAYERLVAGPPQPTVAFDTTSSSGSEAATSVNIGVSLSASSSQTVSVAYSVTGGTASSGTDFTLAAGTLTFAPGTTTKNIVLTVLNDAAVESDETVVVSLSSPSNATLGANTAHTYTIINDDTQSGGAGGPTIDSSPGASSNPATTGVEVQFTIAASSQLPLTYLWEFGDGITSTSGSTATHTYVLSGIYTVKVTVTDSANNSSTATMQITVNDPSGGGGGTPPLDSDGDGVSDADEILAGTNPNDASSFPKTPMSISKVKGVAKFTIQGKDSCGVSGIVPGLPALFDFTNKPATLVVAGAVIPFTLSDKGKAKSEHGILSFKFKTKRNATTKKKEFLGGDVKFTASLKAGTWADIWNAAGIDKNNLAKKKSITVTVDLHFNGKVYTADVPSQYSAVPAKGANFKQFIPKR